MLSVLHIRRWLMKGQCPCVHQCVSLWLSVVLETGCFIHAVHSTVPKTSANVKKNCLENYRANSNGPQAQLWGTPQPHTKLMSRNIPDSRGSSFDTLKSIRDRKVFQQHFKIKSLRDEHWQSDSGRQEDRSARRRVKYLRSFRALIVAPTNQLDVQINSC